jgi:hypothetical protein
MKTFARIMAALLIALPIAITMPFWNAVVARVLLGQTDGDGPGFVGIALFFFLFPALAGTAFFAMRPKGKRQKGLRLGVAAVAVVMVADIALLLQSDSGGPLEHPLDLDEARMEIQQIQTQWPAIQFEYENAEKRLIVRTRKDTSAEGLITISDIGFVDCRIILPTQRRGYQQGTSVTSAKQLRGPVSEMLKAL